ncbi:MAG: hypothetical protein BWY09_03127 [Candidatus Hydrogenedentes bacterium ADurb.Bin179]|nr:MAG: hypothetical protein BWY09_03127 [Candidatus Hydrogenedentes bacterium ADurb.Bin179]
MGKQCIDERKQCVHFVKGRSPGALLKLKRFLLGAYQVIKNGKVIFCRLSFLSANNVERRGMVQSSYFTCQKCSCFSQPLRCLRLVRLPRGAQRNRPTVGHFGNHHISGKPRAVIHGIRAAILGAPQQHIARNGSVYGGAELAMFRKEGNRYAALRAESQQGRTAVYQAKAYNAAQRMNGQFEFYFVFHAHHDGFAFLVQVGALRGDIQGVQQVFHRFRLPEPVRICVKKGQFIMRLSASPVNDENETVRKPGTVPSRFARLRQSLRSELIFRADHEIASNRV